MATMTVRFRGICCFIDKKNGDGEKKNGESVYKRVVLPNGKSHQHDDQEEHLPIIEFYADDLKTAPDDLPRFDYTRPGDAAQYQRIELDTPVHIELLNTPQGKSDPGLNLEDSLVHLADLVDEDIQLKRTLLGPALKVDSKLVIAVVDLPKGVLMAGPPEPVITKFPNSRKFSERRAARWLEHITQVDGEFGLRLTPLGQPRPVAREIWFKSSTRMITIANEPLRFIVGHFVTKPPKPAAKTGPEGRSAAPVMSMAKLGKPTGHFDMYWDLIADPPARPVPEPSQGLGPGCSPSNIP
jgi:hypothetical protein